jgi:nucleoside-diphosphate-sugar epimerase
MKLLVLGGTQFVGRHIVESAQSLGHEAWNNVGEAV